MKKAVMIIGPNGVGKTKISSELARRYNADILNLDRAYLFKYFPITTGLKDSLKEEGVRRHFCEILEPHEKSFEPSDFEQIIAKKRYELQNEFVIAEGASTFYVPELLKNNRETKLFSKIIGLRFSAGFDVETQYRIRIDQAFEDGLIEELQANMTKYQESTLIQECHSAVPTIRYLNGEISLADAKDEILERCLKYKDHQLHLFSEYPEVQWVEVSDLKTAFKEVESLAEFGGRLKKAKYSQ